VAVATAEAFPVALVSEVIALAVAVPDEDAPNAVADRGRVATAVPGAPTVPVSRNLRFPLAPIRAVTASVAALRAAVECVTAIFVSLHYCTDKFVFFYLTSVFTSYFNSKSKFSNLTL
jgi:hypothetical protein